MKNNLTLLYTIVYENFGTNFGERKELRGLRKKIV
jgi:hypothetical protein